MESFREQRCRACLAVFYICPCCDHGQVYCGVECKQAGRDAQVRNAKRKYLTDEDVREGERERQRAYRARVRDQGSQKVAPSASVPIAATRTPMDGGDDRDEGNDHAIQERPGGPMRPADPGGAVRPARPPPRPVEPVGPVQPASAAVRCVFCGRRAQFVRFGPLRRWRTPRWQIQRRDP